MGDTNQLTAEGDNLQSDAPGTSLSVVIPALNEEDGIADIVTRILDTRESLEAVGVTDLEVVVVDDGSTDRTPEIAESIPGVVVVRHEKNRGYGAAIKTGFHAGRGEFLAFLDADSTYPPESFADLCTVAREQDADVVVGSRRSGAESNMPAVRRLGNLIWSTLLSAIGNQKIQDPASGMRVLHRRSLERLYPLPDGLNFTPVMSTRALHEGLRYIERPIPYAERSGRSKLSVVRDGLRFLGTILWTAMQYNPARFLEAGGIGSIGVAAMIWIGLIAARAQGVTNLEAWGVVAVYLGLVLAVGGVSVLSLGLAFNRVVARSHGRAIRQESLLAKLVGPSIEQRFGLIGGLLSAGGLALAASSVALGLNGWELERLWLWMLGSALLLLVGVHLVLFWGLLRVLETLDNRAVAVGSDMRQPVQSKAPAGGPVYHPGGTAVA